MSKENNVAIQTLIYKKVHGNCLSCGENITHPLCPQCIAEGFKEWLKKFTNEEKEIKEKLERFLKAHNYLDGSSKKCISCGKNTTHTCPYCFTEYLYKLVKEEGLGVQAMCEFLFVFNFDFDHKGYYHELEALGGY